MLARYLQAADGRKKPMNKIITLLCAALILQACSGAPDPVTPSAVTFRIENNSNLYEACMYGGAAYTAVGPTIITNITLTRNSDAKVYSKSFVANFNHGVDITIAIPADDTYDVNMNCGLGLGYSCHYGRGLDVWKSFLLKQGSSYVADISGFGTSNLDSVMPDIGSF